MMPVADAGLAQVLTGDAVDASEGHLRAATVFRTSPVALLLADGAAAGAGRHAA